MAPLFLHLAGQVDGAEISLLLDLNVVDLIASAGLADSLDHALHDVVHVYWLVVISLLLLGVSRVHAVIRLMLQHNSLFARVTLRA